MDITAIGRSLLIIALVLFIIGLLILGLGRITGGRGLPGDIVYRHDGITIYLPLITSIVISVILSLILSLVFWFAHRGH